MLCYVASVDTSQGGAIPTGFDRVAFLRMIINDIDDVLDELTCKSPDEVCFQAILRNRGVMQSLEAFLAGAPRPFDTDGCLANDDEFGKLESKLRRSVLNVLQFLFVDAMALFSLTMLQETYKPLLTVVCLLDIASIYYCRDSSDVCSKIINAMFRLGWPDLPENVSQASSDVSENVSMVSMIIMDAVFDAQSDTALKDICDGVQYLRDACFSLCTLMGASEETRYLCIKDGSHLLEALGLIHDTLIPKLYFYLEADSTKENWGILRNMSCELECGAGRAVDMLFDGLLQHKGGDESMASGSSGLSEVSIRRGEALIESICCLNGRDDGEARAGDSLVKKLTHAWNLPNRIQEALDSGIIFLDDAQKHYVLGILSISSFNKVPENQLLNNQVDEIPIKMLTNVSQVEEILPGAYGAGFVALCLQELGDSPDLVINALLSGEIPSHAQAHPRDLDWQGYMALQAPKEENAAGKVEFPELPRGKSKGHQVTTKFLDTIESSYKDRLRRSVVSMQWEYDDEYDDTYDEAIKVAGESTQTSDMLDLPKDLHTQRETPKPKKTWILDGKVYNYPKQGAMECSSQEEVDKVLAEQELSKLEIHGLGPGGNKSVHVENNLVQEKKPTARNKNYSFKEKNKGRIGNHNRKDRAGTKQAKGM